GEACEVAGRSEGGEGAEERELLVVEAKLVLEHMISFGVGNEVQRGVTAAVAARVRVNTVVFPISWPSAWWQGDSTPKIRPGAAAGKSARRWQMPSAAALSQHRSPAAGSIGTRARVDNWPRALFLARSNRRAW